ncbi:hypothetical protein AVEN_74376-1 [Araneus ventricosus]|uniref:Uncharacterized protein n=1 Tax=Araneus ventricosus TaxID=182803 RepID=A0A4Y2SS26_ARAVE|nr:hypothetical protein AVEN_74376-1 [Araneus ventricosus]
MDSKIVKPFMPSFFHIALIKVAVPLFNDFDIITLNMVFTEIQHGNSTASNDGSQENGDVNYYRAKAHLLWILGHLRKRVLEVVTGMNQEVRKWKQDHDYIFKTWVKECTFYWKPDGTIDTIKTAEKLVLNKNINIRKRFELAC